MKRFSKAFIIIAVIMSIIIIPQLSFASGSSNILSWQFSMNQTVPTKITNMAGFIIKLLRNVSIILTIVVITALGIKYMIGSVQEKADYKKSYINIIIGVVLISMITTIVNVIFEAIYNVP